MRPQLFWRGEKIHELGGRRLTKLLIIGHPQAHGGRHMGVPLVSDRVRFDPIQQGVHPRDDRHRPRFQRGGNLQHGRVARVNIPERFPERRIRPDARLKRFIRQHMLHIVGIHSKTEIVRVCKVLL